MTKFGRIAAHVLEYLISGVLLLGGVATMFSPPIVSTNPVIMFLGGKVAVVIYGLIFIFLAGMLLVSKWFKKKNLHKYSLMCIYLVCIFIFWLELSILGWNIALLDEAVIGLLAAGLWLRWKSLTEYISPRQFRKVRVELERKR